MLKSVELKCHDAPNPTCPRRHKKETIKTKSVHRERKKANVAKC